MKHYNHLVSEYYGKYPVGLVPSWFDVAEIGLEIECEGWKLPGSFFSWWQALNDGSLKPPSSPSNGMTMEYRLQIPIEARHVPEALKYLWNSMLQSKSKLVDSNRTSVHVHLNCAKYTFREVFQIICLFIIFEELLVKWCGPEREGNLFCLRACDAEFVTQQIFRGIKGSDYNRFTGDEYRYASLNVAALRKFNSLEFRSMRGCIDNNSLIDVETIQTWVDIIMKIKERALSYPNPIFLIEDFCKLGPIPYLDAALGSHAKILKEVSDGRLDLERKLYAGVRLAQDIAYAEDWTEARPAGREPIEKKKKTNGPPSSW